VVDTPLLAGFKQRKTVTYYFLLLKTAHGVLGEAFLLKNAYRVNIKNK
jgi:hypothetical protein